MTMEYEHAWVRWALAWSLVCIVPSLIVCPVQAQGLFHDKQIKLVVGSDPGGGYDTYARVLARHWSNHIPGKPQIVIQNMPGAGGLKTANFIAHVAPKDGLTVGALQNNVGYEPMMGISGGKENAQFDVLRMNWIGSMAKEVAVTVFWNPPPVRSFEELTKKEVTTGSTGAATSNTIYPRLMNSILGTKFKIIHGYVNQPPIFLAMERGELEGAGGPFYSSLRTTKPEYLRDNKVTIIVQIALEKHPDLPNVPLLLDFAKTAEDRQEMELAVASLLMGRPYVLPEGVPADRVKSLQDSFMATMKDPALLQDAEKLKLEINAIDGSAVHKLLAKMYQTPQPIIDKVTAIFVPRDK
jgi:tripartite-type tricarboxylate transporter receptor subunit TctC